MNVPPRSLLLLGALLLGRLTAATDVRVDFALTTTNAAGAPLIENRFYYVYRPDNLPRAVVAPMVLVMEATPGSLGTLFHAQADRYGFLVVSCAFEGNSVGDSWNNDNPRISGFEDYDYISAVIRRVATAENGGDAFICGLSKGGHTSYAFACERPNEIKAACSVDEFMGLSSNIPSAPVPIMAFQGTQDVSVPYTMSKDSVDAWRAMNGLMSAPAVTTYEAAPLQPGQVTQTTWRGGINGTQVAFVTIVGGDHRWPTAGVQTGFDGPAAVWRFFSQFVTPGTGLPKVFAAPVNNTQVAGQPASFWAVGNGEPPLRYQWQKNGIDIPGATSNWLTVPAVAAGDTGAAFRAVITNRIGTVTTTAATLTVTPAPTAVSLSTQPADLTVTAGQSVTFTITASGTGTLQYQWRKNGLPLPGATTATYRLPTAIPADSGATFSVVVSSGAVSLTSTAATLTVLPAAGAPVVLTNPERDRELIGNPATFSVTAWSPTPATYQWQKGDFLSVMSDVPGATAATYTTPPTTSADQHTLYRCVVSNAAGATNSASEMAFATTTPTAPNDITSPITGYVSPGAPFSYRITSSGGTNPVRYTAAGMPPGLSVDGITGVISGTVANAGTYLIAVTASNAAGSTFAMLKLRVADAPVAWGGERLANVATRGLVDTGEKSLIAGFVISGPAPRRVLLRAIGPGLAKFGVSGTLADPRLTLLDVQGRTVLANDDWAAASGADQVAEAVGAFALATGSKDAATVTTLEPGNYTLRVEGAPAAPRGVALVEVYDAGLGATGAAAADAVTNISTRGLVGPGEGAMIAGFVITGSTPRPVLIRAIAAASLASFGVNGGLGNADLELYDGNSQLVAMNDDWGRSRRVTFLPQAFQSTGAFALSPTSKDAAMLLTLPPGAYTAKVVNRDQTEAVALVEVYQAPEPP